jgi:hypothetical protein
MNLFPKIASELPVAKSHDVIGEPTIADGIMERFVGNAHRLELKGEPLRRKKPGKKYVSFNSKSVLKKVVHFRRNTQAAELRRYANIDAGKGFVS